MRDWLRALKYFYPDARRIGTVFGLMLAGAVLNTLKPWPLALIVDSVLGPKPLPHWFRGIRFWHQGPQIALFSSTLLLLYIAQGALAAAQNYLSIRVGLNGLTRLRTELFAWLQRLSLRFHQGARAGDLIYRASWDAYSVQTLFQQGLMVFLSAGLSLVVMVFVMLRMNAYLTMLALALAPVLALTIKSFGARMRERTTLAQQADSRVTSLVQQGIAALALTQSYTRESRESARFAAQAGEAQQLRLSQHGWELAYWFAIAVVFALAAGAVTWLGALQVARANLTVGELIVFLAYLAQLFEPLNQLSHVGATVAGATAGARRVFEILDTPQEVREHPSARAIPSAGPGDISFAGVAFAYEQGKEVLRDISFDLRRGESAAIMGPSGAGKTTLLHLLPRFFDPTAGAIKLGGIDLRELLLNDLRLHIGLVSQEPVLLSATVAENIAFGRPLASREEIEAAARAANADVFIQRLAKKYDTPLGDGAACLSAGEKQRIHLARAFLKNAPILLLDEPTSALDEESEALIAQSLRALLKGRTALLVAHRPATAAVAQRVFVLQEGRLTERSP